MASFKTLNPNASGFDAVETGVTVDVSHAEDVGVIVGGTFVGTLKIEVSMDSGTTWVQIGSDFTAPGTYEVTIPVQMIRARCSAYTSGAAHVFVGFRDTNKHA